MKRKLEKLINELCSLAKEITPDAEISVSRRSYEGEDAWIEIVAPESKIDELSDKLYPRRADIFHEEGYDIVLSIREKDSAHVSHE